MDSNPAENRLTGFFPVSVDARGKRIEPQGAKVAKGRGEEIEDC
jgi:hypothetical protein